MPEDTQSSAKGRVGQPVLLLEHETLLTIQSAHAKQLARIRRFWKNEPPVFEIILSEAFFMAPQQDLTLLGARWRRNLGEARAVNLAFGAWTVTALPFRLTRLF
jgi:hypothetical protein